MTELLWNTIVTVRTSTRDTMVYPVVRPSTTLAYSTLWHPNGRGLHSTPFKWSKDPLEYHGVFLSFTISRLRGISTTWSLSPLQMMVTKKYRCKGGKSNTHKSQQYAHTQAKTWAQMKHNKFTTRIELKSLRMSIECAKMECGSLRMFKVCLVCSSMRLGVPFIAPRQLGAVESNPGRQFLPSVGWRTGQSDVPPDRHCSLSGADCFPNLVQPTVEDLEPLVHRRGLRGRPLAQPTVGSPDSPVHHRTVRWFLAVRHRRKPESGQFDQSQPGAPNTVRCTQTVLSLGCFSQVFFFFCFPWF
jgi:hypothetical protein